MRAIAFGCMFFAGVVGCQKNPDQQNTALSDSVAALPAAIPAAMATAAVASPDVRASAVPVEEDFEQKAETTISAATVSQEVDRLENEIGK